MQRDSCCFGSNASCKPLKPLLSIVVVLIVILLSYLIQCIWEIKEWDQKDTPSFLPAITWYVICRFVIWVNWTKCTGIAFASSSICLTGIVVQIVTLLPPLIQCIWEIKEFDQKDSPRTSFLFYLLSHERIVTNLTLIKAVITVWRLWIVTIPLFGYW